MEAYTLKNISTEQKELFKRWIADNYEIEEEEDLLEQYDSDIDEASTVILPGLSNIAGSYAMKELDPIAYRCGFLDFLHCLDCHDLNDYDLGTGYIEGEVDDIFEEFVEAVLLQYRYVVNLDERGVYSASVLDCTDKEVFHVENEEDGSLWLCDDGFMKHCEDMDGLTVYLIDMGIIPDDSIIEFVG